uniref:Uncharacterized protein n=1 Tax=Chaetoceros debilis TaxID=122233 RepID=A0A7S3V3T9_9STRA|mmetsp:Transcript_27283/g.41816  ORF Transcript_27283/g.41816 Transcript_27283/m.41816 type:complete len:236 (-) Transcript_27283:723-1430(-)
MKGSRGLIFLRSYQNLMRKDLSFEEDTFSIMMLSKPYTKVWNLGIAAFIIQITLGSMILIKQVQALKEEDFALKLDPLVLFGQGLTIMLCLSSQSDVLGPINFVSFGGRMSSNWDVMIREGGNISRVLYMRRIVFPHVAKLVEGIMVLVTSFFVILQSDDIIDLLQDFTALMVPLETDNVLFHLAVRGDFGHELHKKAESSIVGSSTQRHIRFFVRFLVIFTIIFSMCSGWIYVQ